MKAAAFTEHGGPEVLRSVELPTPEPAAGQVRVRVRAAGVQPYDLAVRGGWTPPGVSPGFPKVPGNEFAGVVDRLGPGVTGVAAGAEVLGFGLLNAYAEYVVIPADQVVAKPAGLSWAEAGGFSAAAQTADIALEMLAIGGGDTVLIQGAAGGVGTAAVQLAADRGATVIGTAHPDTHDHVRSLGATPVAYGPGVVDRVRALAPGGVDAAVNAAGGDALDASLKLVADRNRILTLVDHDRAAELGIRVTANLRSAERLARLVDLHTEGRLRIHVRETYPLDRAADAHRALATPHGLGKIVITVD